MESENSVNSIKQQDFAKAEAYKVITFFIESFKNLKFGEFYIKGKRKQ